MPRAILALINNGGTICHVGRLVGIGRGTCGQSSGYDAFSDRDRSCNTVHPTDYGKIKTNSPKRHVVRHISGSPAIGHDPEDQDFHNFIEQAIMHHGENFHRESSQAGGTR